MDIKHIVRNLLIWGNQEDDIISSKEKSKQDIFIWNIGILDEL